MGRWKSGFLPHCSHFIGEGISLSMGILFCMLPFTTSFLIEGCVCVCVCMLEREMACIYSYVYTHISTYLGAFWWEIFSFDTALLCFVLSQTIKEMIRGFQSKYLTIGKGECGLIEAPFPHFLLSGEGQPRLMQHLHFAGLVPGWNLLLTSPPLLPPPHPRALRVG